MAKLNVQVGDKVIWENRYHKRVTTVTRITPTGRIRVKDSDSQFDNYGQQLGNKSLWDFESIREYDEEEYNRMKDEALIRKAMNLMHNAKVSELSVEDAKAIISILTKQN